MRKYLLVLCALAAVVVVSSASAFDRKPVRLSGLQPNEYGNTISGVESWVRQSRFPRGKHLWCTGVMMTDQPEAKSWFWRGSGSSQVRFWDKFWCRVDLPAIGRQATFIADPMSTSTQVKRLAYGPIGSVTTPPGGGSASSGGSSGGSSSSGGSTGDSSGGSSLGAYYVGELEMNDFMERVFDSAYCDGIARFGKQGEFPYEEYHVFDCSVERDGVYCTDLRVYAVKKSSTTWGVETNLASADCF